MAPAWHLSSGRRGGRPVLVIEIVSPSTRQHDLGAKRRLYYRLGVQKYVLVDRWTPSEAPVRLLGYDRDTLGALRQAAVIA